MLDITSLDLCIQFVVVQRVLVKTKIVFSFHHIWSILIEIMANNNDEEGDKIPCAIVFMRNNAVELLSCSPNSGLCNVFVSPREAPTLTIPSSARGKIESKGWRALCMLRLHSWPAKSRGQDLRLCSGCRGWSQPGGVSSWPGLCVCGGAVKLAVVLGWADLGSAQV